MDEVVSKELEQLRGELTDVLESSGFSASASDCILRVIAAGELDIAYEMLVDNTSEREEKDLPSGETRGRLVAIRERLDRIAEKYR